MENNYAQKRNQKRKELFGKLNGRARRRLFGFSQAEIERLREEYTSQFFRVQSEPQNTAKYLNMAGECSIALSDLETAFDCFMQASHIYNNISRNGNNFFWLEEESEESHKNAIACLYETRRIQNRCSFFKYFKN